MKAYQAYKPSGVEWLGEVPEHWEICPIRNIFKFRNEKNNPVRTENILSLSIANGVTEYTEENRGGNKRKDDLTAYKLAYPNDIVLNSMNVIVGAVGRSKFFGAISPVYYALYLYRNDDIRFYDYVFSNSYFQRGLLQYGKGILIKKSDSGKLNTIRMKISQDDLKMLFFPRPPLAEQQKIAQYLDTKTAKIDTLIDEQNRLIALLQEQRKAVISHAVTKGINPTTPMKPSGVEWLGEVPEHWEVKRLKYALQLSNEKTESKNSDLRYIGMENIISNRGELTENILQADGMANVFYENEILFGKLRPYLAKVYLANFNGICSTEFLVYKIKNIIAHKFAFYLLISQGFIDIVNSSTYGSKMPRANADFLANLSIPIPPLSEQNEIVAYIETQTAQIDALIDEQKNLIDRLNEYRTALISAAVTGKIDVQAA
ncbi:TPA: restriction endonuclease subunit S [Mannheimia haemolytica]